ncbi:hypothetical protein KDA_23750 [Dictyobacter alpinus]|uniref:Uncharacterized protein n=1 Tax=Dictyobacter alpinus TaxID=2014873 RepID=A0A402B6B0_9CHLR|nr:hypothetical protein [Dictyobacter alpinus]GCE26891.1 hypothetical protein KDA_23750 [Dictyobacter alpinus]
MRKNDPMRRYYIFFFAMEGFIILNLLFNTATSLAFGRPNYFLIGETLSLSLLLILAFFVFKRRHQRTELRRRQAISGNSAFLAQPQPQPDANALTLPVRIALRLDLKKLFIFTTSFLLLTLIIMATVLFVIVSPQNISFIAIFVGIMFVMLLFMSLIIFAIFALFLRKFLGQEIIVDEYGIATKIYSKPTFIAWQDIQSFAMWGNAKRFATIQFEVTSENGVVRWFQLGPQRSLLTQLSMLKPDMPFDQYQDITARLQQVIIAHSGKPLYDLRDEKIFVW